MTDSRRDAVQLSDPHPTITVYSTLTKRKEPLRTVKPGHVGVYLCGPTVYDKAHIGHMVGPVIFDTIKRYLAYCGFKVNWVVNITDVDDKLINKANERGITMLEVAEENIADYHGNLAALGVDQIDHFPRATECMPEIIDFVQGLIDAGYAYESAGDVYFDVAKDPGYGKLSNRTLDAIQGDGGGGAERKRNSADFALWKSAKPGEPSWESPWAPGRPGWHIECSAMSKKLLGETFDIHGGGLDLVFPHHENEIAQSECCHGKPFATYWAHNGLLRRDAAAGKIGGRAERDANEPEASAPGDQVSGKMSRSKGAGGLATLIANQGGERIRFFLLRTHYRSTVLFSEPAIEEAGVGLDTFYRLFKRYHRITQSDFYAIKPPAHRDPPNVGEARLSGPGAQDTALHAAYACKQKFLASMDDDFNTGGAVAELFELAKITNRYCDENNLESGGADNNTIGTLTLLLTTLKELANILGLFLGEPRFSGPGNADADLLSKVMPLIIDLRAEARTAKNFAIADAIRDGLAPAGIKLEDRPGGAEWTGGGADALDAVMQLLIQLRQTARQNKDFATGDAIRNRLADLGVKLEDRPGGAEWTRG